MATLTIRNVDEQVKRKLQIRAARNGRSMEAEVRSMLAERVEIPMITNDISELNEGLGTAIHKLFAPFGGVELEIPSRTSSTRPLPTFD